MFDELYPQASEVALEAKLNRPPETQAPKFSTWGMLSAAPKGLAAGAAQAIGSTADMLGAYGSVMGSTGGSAGGMFATQTPEERKQQQDATDKLMSGGPDYMSDSGRLFRDVAKDYTPDPVTTHAAEGAVFNLFRMGGKAITAAATLGNIPGAIVAGAEEGFTMADELAGQGVDIGTRTQVGAVNAVMNAAAFALPAAGKTWMQTGALALVGGPISFVSQQAATKEILQAADYTKQAEQYDPFDPLGLALSTVIPLGFGALAMRGAKVRAKDVAPPDEIVDAARVSLVRQHMDSTNPVPGDLAATDAHVKAYSQAMEQMAAGERVSVDDVAPISASLTDPIAVWGAGLKKALDDVAAANPPKVAEAAPVADVVKAPNETRTLADEAVGLLNGGRSPAEVIGALEATGAKVSPELQNMLIGASEFGGRINELVDQVNALKAQRGPNAQAFDVVAQAVDNMRNGTKAEAPNTVNPLDSQLKAIEVGNPTALDAEISMDTGKVTMREYLDMIKKEAAQDTTDASLIEVAANCFLSGAT